MTAAQQTPTGDPYYRLPHPLSTPPLAAGIYWRAVCHCHYGQVVGLNPHAKRGAK